MQRLTITLHLECSAPTAPFGTCLIVAGCRSVLPQGRLAFSPPLPPPFLNRSPSPGDHCLLVGTWDEAFVNRKVP